MESIPLIFILQYSDKTIMKFRRLDGNSDTLKWDNTIILSK